MVHKIEAACESVGIEFNGCVMNPREVTLNLQKGDSHKKVTLPVQTFEVLNVEQLAVKIKALFVGTPTCL